MLLEKVIYKAIRHKCNKPIENICQKAFRKLKALARLAQGMEVPEKGIPINAFFKLQFIAH